MRHTVRLMLLAIEQMTAGLCTGHSQCLRIASALLLLDSQDIFSTP